MSILGRLWSDCMGFQQSRVVSLVLVGFAFVVLASCGGSGSTVPASLSDASSGANASSAGSGSGTAGYAPSSDSVSSVTVTIGAGQCQSQPVSGSDIAGYCFYQETTSNPNTVSVAFTSAVTDCTNVSSEYCGQGYASWYGPLAPNQSIKSVLQLGYITGGVRQAFKECVETTAYNGSGSLPPVPAFSGC
jgi:hypothetical protein